MSSSEWDRFLNYVDHDVRGRCTPQRASLARGPFEWMQTLSGSAFGNKIGPSITRFFLQDEQGPRENPGHDFIFQGRKIELKTGTEHSSKGVFLFQQIRPSQNWDGLLCVGIAVRSLTFLALGRSFVEDAIEKWRNSGKSVITPQHGGAKRRNRHGPAPDTFWLWTRQEWASQLEPYQSFFDSSGWQGRRLQETLTF